MNLSSCDVPGGKIVSHYWYNWSDSQLVRASGSSGNWYAMAVAYENDPNKLDNAIFITRRRDGPYHGWRSGLYAMARLKAVTRQL